MQMKDQYVGDINDYCKYGLLRALTSPEPSQLNVCWMLTAPDGRGDGGKIAYLQGPQIFRPFDPPLFDALGRLVMRGERSVRGVEASGVLPNARFFPPILSDDPGERSLYFDSFRRTLRDDDVVFFDPDNGLEVRSVPRGRRGSAKYLYWDELGTAIGASRALCIYQHFPYRPRQAFLSEMLGALVDRWPSHVAFAVATAWVAYLILAPPERLHALRHAAITTVARESSPCRDITPTVSQ